MKVIKVMKTLSIVAGLALCLNGFVLAAPLGIGEEMPELEAEGWLNGDEPAEDDFKDKVVVIEVWAYW